MMKQYETKKINAIWLNSIPSHWASLKFKKLFDEINIKNYPQLQLLVASQNMGVVPKNIYGKRTVEAQKDLDKLKLVMPDNFVISLRSFQGGIEYSIHKGIISPAYTILKQKLDNNSLFFKYLFKSFSFIKLLQLCVTGIREGQNIDYDTLKEHIIPIPPREEQNKIVAYLDYQVSNINKLILSKRKQITLLEEYKKTKISEVVTKGLNPNVEMKDSGIDWIGQIPKHWEVIKIKKIIEKKFSGSWGDNINQNNINSICIRVSDFDYNKLKLTEHNSFTIRSYSSNEYNKILLKKYDILIEKSGGGDKTCVGRTILFQTDINAICSNFIDVLRVYQKKVVPSFIQYNFVTLYYTEKIKKYIKQTTGIQNLDINLLLTMEYIPIPPLNEQKEIATYLDNLTFKLDNLISKHKLYIEKLEEYKKTLISDVVTGKIDVRDIVIPEYKKVDIVENNYEDTDNLAME